MFPIHSEKKLLLALFSLFFLLSGALIYVMLIKDMKTEETKKQRMSEPPTHTAPENVWPKVEIQTRQ